MLLLRALRWRLGYSVAVLLVGLVSAAVAAVGPLYARAATESTLSDELTAGGARAGLAFTAPADVGSAGAVARLAASLGGALHLPHYGTPIAARSVSVGVHVATSATDSLTTLATRDGQCAHVVILRGRCPAAAGEVLVDEDSIRSGPRWHIGQAMTLRTAHVGADGEFVEGAVLSTVHVVGSYRPRNLDDPFWFGRPYFNARLGPAVTSAIKGGVDTVFATPSEFAALKAPADGLVSLDVPLRTGSVRLDDVPALRREIAAVQRRYPDVAVVKGAPVLQTALPAVLDSAARDQRQVRAACLVVVLELAALSWLVLFQVVGGAVSARGNEIALAKLRGHPPWRTVVFALAEPLLLLALAAPLGLLVALAVTRSLADGVLVAGTPVLLRSGTWWALGAAFVGSAAAAALAAVRVLTRPVLEQWRITQAAPTRARLLLVVDAIMVAAAAAVLVGLRLGGDRPHLVYLAAPALLVLAVALIGVRLLPRLGRLGLAPTRATRHVAAFLALRQTVRRVEGLRLAVLLALATGLATFAACGEAVALSNRTARAQTEVGAVRQVSAQFLTGNDPETAVQRADPQGRWAMAVASWSPDGAAHAGPTINGLLLGVQADRLAATTYAVRGQLSPRQIATAIAGTAAAPVHFRGRDLTVRLRAGAIHGPAPTVEISVQPYHLHAVTASAGLLRPGTHDYTVRTDCTQSCRFASITVDPPAGYFGPVSAAVTIEAVSSGGRPVGARLDPAAWRADAIGYVATARLSAAPGGGVAASVRSDQGSATVLSYGDSPRVLPLVVTPHAATTSAPRPGSVVDYTGSGLDYAVAKSTRVLPEVLDGGAVANLDYLRERLPGFDEEAAWSVWLGPHAPKDALAKLQRAGLIVQEVSTTRARVDELGRQGPALGLLLLLVCAVAAALLAVGATSVALLAGARRRSFEFAALRMIGVRPPSLRRSAVAEQALVLCAALVLGVPSGWVAARLTLPSVPEFADRTPVVLLYSPPALVAVALGIALGFLVAFTAYVAGRALVRAAVPARLREVER
jgi:hypothetical protein